MQKAYFIFLFFWCGSVSAQTISFDITVFGSTVGRMKVAHLREVDGSDIYTIESNSQARILWITKTYHSKFEVRYKDGKMIYASHLETENNKVKRWSKVVFDGKKYEVDSDKGKRSFTESPAYTDLSLFFDDYKKVNRVFYLPEADFNNITHVDDNTVEFKSSDGHRNVYFFEKGIIKQMEFHLALATVYMKRVN